VVDVAEKALDGAVKPGEDTVEVEVSRLGKSMAVVNVYWHGRLVHGHKFDLCSATSRRGFAERAVEEADERFGAVLDASTIERQLLAESDRGVSGRRDRPSGLAEYELVEEEDVAEGPGLYRRTPDGLDRMTNFTLLIGREVKVHDEYEPRTVFEGTLRLEGRDHPFAIPTADYPDGRKLLGAVYDACGPRARVACDPAHLRDAIGAVSDPQRVEVTTGFGWTGDATAFLAPGGVVDAGGFRPYRDGEVRVDLSGEPCARHLALRGLDPADLDRVRRHLVDDFLALHDRQVTYPLLGAIGLAPLYRFLDGLNRFALWMTGDTGAGKSFACRLAQNFFGDFPVGDGSRVGSWTSTAFSLQRQGYFFKDAMFLIDDYKPDLVKQRDVVMLLQNYADTSARGRLNRDSKGKTPLPIRGLLVATGEDVPEHSASALARSVIVRFPRRPNDLVRGRRCLEYRDLYRGVMADYLRRAITLGRPAAFAARLSDYQQRYYRGLGGCDNGLRIASNLAQLAAGFHEFAEYLADVWPAAEAETGVFADEILMGLRDRMAGAVRAQAGSEIFLKELRHLLAFGVVRVERWRPRGYSAVEHHAPLVGRLHLPVPAPGFPPDGGHPEVVEISASRAMAAVQESLRKQGRPELRISEGALYDELIAKGLLLDNAGKVMTPDHGGPRSYNKRLDGGQIRLARIPASALGLAGGQAQCGPEADDDEQDSWS
jgi:hypothetical protein